jgi:hypothetical protein
MSRIARMWSFIRGEPDAVVRWAGPLILFGMLLGFTSARLEIPGVISAVYAVFLGASGGALAQWRTDRDLWMLAGLFLLFCGAFYGVIIYSEIDDIVCGALGPEIGLLIDFSIGTTLLSISLRFLWRVARYNWTFSRESSNA